MVLRNPPEDPITRALAGDEDALEEVLGNLAAPTFDLAVHLFGSDAEQPTISALARLAAVVRAGPPLPIDDPLAIPARHLLILAADSLPSDPAFGHLSTIERKALLAATAVDLEGEAVAFALGLALAETQVLLQNLQSKLQAPEAIRDLLDEHAAKYPMPRGMVDRALAV
jgi:hypothetical protein